MGLFMGCFHLRAAFSAAAISSKEGARHEPSVTAPSVEIAHGEGPSVRRETRSGDSPPSEGKRHQFLMSGDAPQFHFAVVADGRSVLPSGENSTPVSPWTWPLSVAIWRPEGRSHRRASLALNRRGGQQLAIGCKRNRSHNIRCHVRQVPVTGARSPRPRSRPGC